jgi:hypothetical protein
MQTYKIALVSKRASRVGKLNGEAAARAGVEASFNQREDGQPMAASDHLFASLLARRDGLMITKRIRGCDEGTSPAVLPSKLRLPE